MIYLVKTREGEIITCRGLVMNVATDNSDPMNPAPTEGPYVMLTDIQGVEGDAKINALYDSLGAFGFRSIEVVWSNLAAIYELFETQEELDEHEALTRSLDGDPGNSDDGSGDSDYPDGGPDSDD